MGRKKEAAAAAGVKGKAKVDFGAIEIRDDVHIPEAQRAQRGYPFHKLMPGRAMCIPCGVGDEERVMKNARAAARREEVSRGVKFSSWVEEGKVWFGLVDDGGGKVAASLSDIEE